MSLILFIHIFGGIAALVSICWSIFSLIFKKGSMRFTNMLLQLTAIFQLASGILLIFFEKNVSVAAVCYKGLGYLIVAGALQYLLQKRFSTKSVV